MTVKSASRVLDIFELLSDNPDGLTANEISKVLSLPQSSAFNLVKTMVLKGFLNETDQKKYKLGPKLVQIGTKAMETLDVNSEAYPYLRRLMEKIQETVFMAVVLDQELVYVAKVDNQRSIRTSAQLGARKPLYCTGLGKIYLAHLPKEERTKILNKGMPRITRHTVTDAKTLNQQLEQFREQGYAIDDEENEEGLYCFAAPIFNVKGTIEAAISVAGPKERVRPRGDLIIKELLETAGNISKKLGY